MALSADAALLLDQAVEFEERNFQPFGQMRAQRGFAGAAQSDQRDAAAARGSVDAAEMLHQQAARLRQFRCRQPPQESVVCTRSTGGSGPCSTSAPEECRARRQSAAAAGWRCCPVRFRAAPGSARRRPSRAPGFCGSCRGGRGFAHAFAQQAQIFGLDVDLVDGCGDEAESAPAVPPRHALCRVSGSRWMHYTSATRTYNSAKRATSCPSLSAVGGEHRMESRSPSWLAP